VRCIARDTKPKREVAIKVLPDAFARDVERVARFQREAEVLASLNHPHIAVGRRIGRSCISPGIPDTWPKMRDRY